MKITGRKHRAISVVRAGPPFTKTLGAMFRLIHLGVIERARITYAKE